jgi:aerobic C4-dicarboxylate transport protein
MGFLRKIYCQVLIAIAIGATVGALWPATGAAMKPLGDAFIALIRMMIGPVIFCTIVHGIGSMHDMAKVGRIGLKALIFFEVISTFALVLGLVAAHLVHPGVGLTAHVSDAGAKAVAGFVTKAEDDSVVAHLLAIIPPTFTGAFTAGDLLPVLLVSILTGVALSRMGATGAQIAHGVDLMGKVFFKVINIIVYAAPIGTFGAMAYTIGAFGVKALANLGMLVATFYGTSLLFVFLVLGTISHLLGFSILKFLRYMREELFIVLGTSSSEPALPNLMRKLEVLGVPSSVVGLVVPTGYSFNLCGTNIYMTLGILFLAQATNTHLTFVQEATIILIAMLTSKGAAGVTGAGFITLAATLTYVPAIPIASLGLLLGVDRFMSECRSLTNFISNGVTALAVARWERVLDHGRLTRQLNTGPGKVEDVLPV